LSLPSRYGYWGPQLVRLHYLSGSVLLDVVISVMITVWYKMYYWWYGKWLNVDLYSAIITKVSNALVHELCVSVCWCRCPYAGCGNLIALTMEDLVENAELRAHINKQSTVSDTPSWLFLLMFRSCDNLNIGTASIVMHSAVNVAENEKFLFITVYSRQSVE